MDMSAMMSMFGPLQQQMQAAAAKRADEKVEGTAGGGAISVTLTGDLQVTKVTIAPAAAAAVDGDASMLEDLMAAACTMPCGAGKSATAPRLMSRCRS